MLNEGNDASCGHGSQRNNPFMKTALPRTISLSLWVSQPRGAPASQRTQMEAWQRGPTRGLSGVLETLPLNSNYIRQANVLADVAMQSVIFISMDIHMN